MTREWSISSCSILLSTVSLISAASCSNDSRLRSIRLPQGFSFSLYAGNVPGARAMALGPDGHLYVPVGAPCNVCEVEDPCGTISRLRPDGKGLEVYARGVRNSVGFDWDPDTEELWFTDNGRDWLGDDIPLDELNHSPVKGLHFGFSFRHGKGIADPVFGGRMGGEGFVPPAMELGPYVASLGMRFYTGSMFPES